MFLVLAVMTYQAFLSQWESRSLISIIIFLEILGAVCDLGIVLRWNVALGIPDLAWAALGSVAIQFFTMGFNFLIPYILVSKITPAHVEATVFAFASMVINVAWPMGRLMGTVWNRLFKVDAENMENLDQLIMLTIALTLVTFCYLPLIPSWEAI